MKKNILKYPVKVLMYAVLSVIGVFLGDLLVAFVDPRIKLTEGE